MLSPERRGLETQYNEDGNKTRETIYPLSLDRETLYGLIDTKIIQPPTCIGVEIKYRAEEEGQPVVDCLIIDQQPLTVARSSRLEQALFQQYLLMRMQHATIVNIHHAMPPRNQRIPTPAFFETFITEELAMDDI